MKYNGSTYIYRKDVQGNIISLLDSNGRIVVKYAYDAWGYHTVYDSNGNINTDENFFGNINPFRYRSYYYDTETKLYFLKTRYYDPEVGRFISPDSIEYLDPETINGLNLYAYCGNNPVMYTDPNGTAKWWQWFLFGVGAALVVAAAIVLTVASGGAAGGLIGAVAIGAAKGALIGAAVGSAVGIAGGAIYAGVTGADIGQSILSGFLMGFGIGAIAGAIIGGAAGANGWYNAKALEFTRNPMSNEVVLGRSGVYEKFAEGKGATYFKMPDAEWIKLSQNSRTVWNINKAFLRQQLKAGKTFIMASNPVTAGGYYFMKEVAYLLSKGIKWIL